VTLILTAFLIVAINPAVVGIGSYKLGTSGEPILDGFRALYGDAGPSHLGSSRCRGSSRVFMPSSLALGDRFSPCPGPATFLLLKRTWCTRHLMSHSWRAQLSASWFALDGKEAAPVIGSVLLNMAVFGAMLSYILRAISFIVLRRRNSNMPRPFLSPFGQYDAVAVIVISAVTLFYQLQDPNFSKGVLWVIVWFATASAYFALRGRQRLMLSPEEVLALQQKAGPALAPARS